MKGDKFFMYQQDWMMRQIGDMVKVIARIVFKKDTMTYEITNNEISTETDLLYKELIELLNSLKINEAEDLLFKNIKTDNIDYLKIAVDFYNRLNELSDDELDKADFSRDEIKSGLEDISKIFGVSIWKQLRE
jgi:hypothetical protein